MRSFICFIVVFFVSCMSMSVAQQVKISDKIQPISQENIFRDPDCFNWCSSIIQGEDGKYHLIYSRWKRSYAFNAWLTHSTIAHAVADTPAGPYKYVNTLMDFEKDNYGPDDMITAHNSKIKYFEGKYYLYFCSTHMDRVISNEELKETAKGGPKHKNWRTLRENQRTFVASSTSLDKPFKVDKRPLLEPEGSIETLVVNPAICYNQNKYFLIVKGDKPGSTKFERNQAVAVSEHPDRGFKIQPKPVIQDWDTEDVSMWYDKVGKRFYAVFHAHTYIGMMTSQDGLNWEKAEDFEIMKKRISRTENLDPILPDRMERPFVFLEDNVPVVLSLAVMKGDDAYIVFVRLKK